MHVPVAHLGVVELAALVLHRWCRFTGGTNVGTKLAAVCVIVEDVVRRPNLATRWGVKSNIEEWPTAEWDRIWKLRWLEEHDVLL